MPGGPAGWARGRWAAAALRGGAGHPVLARHGAQGGAAARTLGLWAGTQAPPLGPGSASTPGTALPRGERSARLSVALRDSAGRDGGLAAASRPRRPRTFISSAPARLPALHSVPASALPRRPELPTLSCPTRPHDPPALRAGAGKGT